MFVKNNTMYAIFLHTHGGIQTPLDYEQSVLI